MARGKSNNSSDSISNGNIHLIRILLLVAMLLWLGCFILACVPLIIIGGAMYYYYLFNKRQLVYQDAAANDILWLDEDEKKEFISLYDRLQEAYQEIEKVEFSIEKENLPKNKDGTLSYRTNRGKALNEILDHENWYVKNYSPKLKTLESLPVKRWEELEDKWFLMKRALIMFVNLRIVLVLWPIIYIMAFFIFFETSVNHVKNVSSSNFVEIYTAFIEDWYHQGFSFLNIDWHKQFGFILLGVTILLGLFVYMRRKMSLKQLYGTFYKYHSKPEVVTIENYNKF